MTTFVVGYGKIYHRSDAGVWTDHTPGGIGSNHRIMSVWAPSPIEAYAVGYHYYTYGPIYYKWGGSSWLTWNVTPNPGAYWRANHISAASRNEIYIVFYNASDRDIKVWKGDYTGSGSYILEWYCSPYYANGCGYTAGQDEFYLPMRGSGNGSGASTPNTYMKKWGGSSWSDSENLPDSIVHIGGANGNIYATYGSSSPSFSIYRGSWDSWNTDVSPGDFRMASYQHESDIWAYEDKCWIAGFYNNSGYKPAIAYYDGDLWDVIALPTSIEGYIDITFGIHGIDEENIIYACTKTGDSAYAYVFNGSVWAEEEIGAAFNISDVFLTGPLLLDPANPPATTYDIESDKSYNRAFYFLHIEGFPYIWTSDENATDWWTAPTGFTFRPGLMMLPGFSEFSYSKQLDIFAGIEDEDSVDVTICDSLLHALFATKQQETDANRGYLTTNDIGAGTDPNLIVDRDITGAPSGGGTIYLGNQTVTYTSKSGTTFSGVNRGRYAILDADLDEVTWKPYTDWDEDMNIPLRVTTFPQRIEGRVLTIWRCYRHVDTGVPLAKSQSTIRFRGKITAYGVQSTPNGYDLHANSIITELNQDVMSRAPTASVYGYHISSGEIGKPQLDKTTYLRFHFSEQLVDMAATKTGDTYKKAMQAFSVNGIGWTALREFTINQNVYFNVDELIKAINDELKSMWDAGDTFAPWSCWRDQSGRVAVGYAPVGLGCEDVDEIDYLARTPFVIPKGNTNTSNEYEIYCGVKGAIYGSYAWSALGFGKSDGEWIDVFDTNEAYYKHSFALWTNENNSLYSGYVMGSGGVDYPYQPVTLFGKEEAAQAWCRLDAPFYIPTDDVSVDSQFVEVLDDGSPFIIKVGDKAIYRASYIEYAAGANGKFYLIDPWEDFKHPIASAAPPDDEYLSVPESTMPEDVPRVRQVYMPTGRRQITDDQDNGDETTTEYTINQYGVCFTMLRLMLSTGTADYNSAEYDQLPVGWGLGIPKEYIDVESFEDLYDDMPPGSLVRRWIFDESTNFREFLEAEAKTLGFLITVQSGKITVIPTHKKALNRDSQLTIDDSVRILGEPGRWRTAPEGIFNVIKLRSDYDYLERKFYSVDTYIDRASQVDTRVINAVEIENNGLASTVLKGANDKALTAVRAMMHERLQEYSRESYEYSCEVNRKADGLMLGDIVRVTDAFVPNPMEGTIGIIGHLGRIIAIDFNEIEGRGTLTIRLAYDYDAELATGLFDAPILNLPSVCSGFVFSKWESLSSIMYDERWAARNGFAVGEKVKITNTASGSQWETAIKSINLTNKTIEFDDEMSEARQAFLDGEAVLSYVSYAKAVAESTSKTELFGGYLNGKYRLG